MREYYLFHIFRHCEELHILVDNVLYKLGFRFNIQIVNKYYLLIMFNFCGVFIFVEHLSDIIFKFMGTSWLLRFLPNPTASPTENVAPDATIFEANLETQEKENPNMCENQSEPHKDSEYQLLSSMVVPTTGKEDPVRVLFLHKEGSAIDIENPLDLAPIKEKYRKEVKSFLKGPS